MHRLSVYAASIGLISTAVLAQAPPPSPTGGDYLPRPPGMGPQDTATDPNSLDRVRDAIQNNRLDAIAVKARSDLGRSRPAKADEVKAGKPVNDSQGQLIALIEKIEPEGAVLYNGATYIRVSLNAFGMNKKGLLLDMTKQEFDKLAAAANPPKKP